VIQGMLKSIKSSEIEHVIKAQELVKEILFCNSAILMAFTPCGQGSNSAL
jgi:hypothetical protein